MEVENREATRVEVSDATVEMMDKLKPIVHEIIELVSSAKLPCGNLTAEEQDKYQPVAKETLALLLKHDIKYFEETVVFQLVGQVFNNTAGIVQGSLKKSYETFRDLKFGKPLDEVLISDIDETIKSSAPKNDVDTTGIPTA